MVGHIRHFPTKTAYCLNNFGIGQTKCPSKLYMILGLCTFSILRIWNKLANYLFLSDLLHTHICMHILLYKKLLTDQFYITEGCLNKLHEHLTKIYFC